MIISGEASGDMHGSGLVRELKKIHPELDLFGIGGDEMAAEGVETVRHVRDMSFLGFWEVIKHLPHIRRVYKQMTSLLDDRRPDLLILIDYPGFNLRFAREAHKRGIPVIYYISPQVWAWKEGRVKTIRKLVSRMIVLFPFEKPIYEKEGMDVVFVGHPLKERVKTSLSKEAFFQAIHFDPARPAVGILPGSRQQEIVKLLPPMVDAFDEMKRELPDLQGVLAMAPMIDRELYAPLLNNHPDIHIVHGNTYEIMGHTDSVMVASGTATLETALLGTPMTILYKISHVSYLIGRALVKLSHFGLANIVAGKGVVVELLQKDVNGKRIASELLPFYRDENRLKAVKAELDEISRKLGDTGASKRAAEAVDEFWQKRDGANEML